MTTTLFGMLSAPTRLDLTAVARAFARESDSVGTVLLTSDGKELVVGAAFPSAPDTEALLHIPVGQGVSGQVARNGHAIRLAADAPRTPAYRELLGIHDTGEVARMCMPVRGIDGQILGVVSLHRPTDRPYIDEDITRFQPYADLLGIRLQARGLLNAVDEHRHDRDRLIAAAISAQETERRLIAFDLHDGVTTALASMSFHLNAAELSLHDTEQRCARDNPESAEALAQARSQIATARTLGDLAYNQTRAAITGLHSLVLDDLGLVAALESLAETAPGVAVRVVCDAAAEFTDIPDHEAAALFRIAQETMSNAARHARASSIELSLRREDDVVVLRTSDDGIGFDARAVERRDDEGSHYGLSSLAERCALVGASLRIDSVPGHGTTVIVELPLAARPEIAD
ncbi:MAG: GAF domain-containing sensor histidine kinase [Nocardioidaceae bacterium]|nr:GAF domain-containing sensor histidine kinase [Nocardioidaceae bacterium]